MKIEFIKLKTKNIHHDKMEFIPGMQGGSVDFKINHFIY